MDCSVNKSIEAVKFYDRLNICDVFWRFNSSQSLPQGAASR